MEQLRCYLCSQRVPGGLDGLRNHFIQNHGLTINRGLGNEGFICGEINCQRNFKNFYSLRRHVRQNHTVENDAEDAAEPREVNHNQDQDPEIPLNGAGMNDIPFDAPNINNNNNNNTNGENQELVDNEEINVNRENYNLMDDLTYNDLRTFIIRMISRLHSNCSMNGAMISRIIDEFEELSMLLRDFFKQAVLKHIREQQLLGGEEENNLLEVFNFESPFADLRNLDQQMKALKDRCNYIEPQEIPLGKREDTSLDKENCTYLPTMVTDTFQYVPIIDVLKLVLSNPTILEAIEHEEPSPDGILSSFVDGQYCKNHAFFSRFPRALKLGLYYDELEIVNPLGSKTTIHKLGCFYYKILNLPSHMQSELSAIHVLVICCDADVKKYGFEPILEPFLQDLLKLESEDGVNIQINGEEFILRASIASFCGDGLAVHQVYNLLSPSADKFCRMCMYSRKDLHEASVEQFPQRTEDLFKQHLSLLEENNFNDNTKTETGVKGDCCFNKSRYFHIADNKIFDPFHDFLQGICPMIIKLVLKELVIVDRKFSIEYFNNRISTFDYGYVEIKNKPSANFTNAMIQKSQHSISQKGMQTWLLMRVFPFLVFEKAIADENEYLGLIVHLLRIMEIVFAPKLATSLIPYLRALIIDFFQLFKRLFPEINPINKFHHLSHYPESILWAGPINQFNCARFEGKHNEIKTRAQTVHNFKNPPKTLVRAPQSVQSSKWGAGDVQLHKFQILNGFRSSVRNTLSTDHLKNLGYADDDQVFKSCFVRVDGTEYRIGLYVCLEVANTREDNLPLFGRIKEIIIVNKNNILLSTAIHATRYFDDNLNAFCIENDDSDLDRFVEVFGLAHYKPYCGWSQPTSDDLFISLRHILL